jgi:hypothetical protein
MAKHNKVSSCTILIGVLAGISMFAISLPAALAQGRNHNGDNRSQGQQDRSGQHNQQWNNHGHSNGSAYYNQSNGRTRWYHNSEHRKYYSYQGSEFYLNLDNGIRVRISS